MPGDRPQALTSPAEVLAYVSRELQAGIGSPEHPWHWPALATAADARVVVSRDYDPQRRTWRFYSDRRAPKVEQLAKDPCATALFYHGAHRTQLRLSGRVAEQTDPGLRRALWTAQHDASRRNYATLLAPGHPVDDPVDALPQAWPDAASLARAFAAFGVFELTVQRFDFLQIVGRGSRRARWSADGLDFAWVTP